MKIFTHIPYNRWDKYRKRKVSCAVLCTYQCKPRGGGGEGRCGQGVGIWPILKFLDQIPQGGKLKVDQKCQKSPHPGGKN